MKIGIDCRLWNESGVGRYIRNLVKHLQMIDRKNEYVLFVLSKDFESIKYQISKIKNNWKLEIGNWRLTTVDIRWHTIEEQLKFPQIINKENLDLMHFTYSSVPIFYKRPFVITIHDLILHHFPTGEASTLFLPLYYLKHLGYKLVISQAAKKAKKIITVSNATKREIIDHLGVDKNKVMVTYEGVGGKITNPKSQIPNKSSSFAKASADKQNTKYSILNTQYFLYVGNAYPHKNLDRLLKAFTLFCHPEALVERSSQILRSAQNDTKLVLVGREDYFYKKLKNKANGMGLKDSVIFYGEATDEELQGLYRNALVLIMPSLMEGFGLSALEAMSNRCLVLASDIPSLREICGDCAVYFDRYNVEDIAQTMKTIHSNDINHYSNNIKEGFERAKMFSWEKMAKETLRIYEDMMKK